MSDYTIHKIDFQTAFTDFFSNYNSSSISDNQKNVLYQSILSKAGLNTDAYFEKINNRYEIRNRANCKLPRISKIKEKSSASASLSASLSASKNQYFNYIIGINPISRQLYLRAGVLDDKSIIEFFSTNNAINQIETYFGIKHLNLCSSDLVILFSGILIVDKNKKVIITPSSGSWANNMYLLIHPNKTFQDESESKKKINYTEVDTFLRSGNNLEDLKNLNCLNIIATSYALKNSDSSVKIDYENTCFTDYFAKRRSNARQKCIEDIPFLKSKSKKLKDKVLQELKKIIKPVEFKLSIFDLLVNKAALSRTELLKHLAVENIKDDNPIIIEIKNNDKFKLLNNDSKRAELSREILKINNIKDFTFESLLTDDKYEGSIKKAQTYFSLINKRLSTISKKRKADDIK
jgi:hypothetical protein